MLVKFGADAPIKSYGGSKFPKTTGGTLSKKKFFFEKSKKIFIII